MTTRYLITSRTLELADAALEVEGAGLVARLDRGYLADLDQSGAERLSRSGLRLKALDGVDKMRLYDYVIDTARGATPELPDLPGAETQDEFASHSFLVQFIGPLQESWLGVLHQRGVVTVEPIGQYGYFVQADPSVAAGLQGLLFVAWVGPFEPAYKVHPALLARPGVAAGTAAMPTPGQAPATTTATPTENPDVPGIIGVNVGVLADADVGPILEIIEANNGEILDGGAITGDQFRNILARFDDAAIGALARRDDVRWLDPMYESMPEDERTAQISYEDLNGAAAPNTAPVIGYNANLAALDADGTGTTIAICDTGVGTNVAATMHADLNGRFAFSVDGQSNANLAADADGHGTHVAGIAAGNGASGDTDPQGFVLGQGLAPGADVGSIAATSTWANRIATAAQNDADVMNSSLGVNPAGAAYSASDRAIDLGVRDADPAGAGNRPITLVFSAGNSGPGAQSCTKATKNAIVVGNALNFRPGEGDPSDDIRGLRTSSSRGPTADGRIFPVLTAPGTDVVSARGGGRPAYTDTNGVVHSTHARLSGTSMASPAIAGVCAVLTEWWRSTRNGATPSPALLKAMLAVSTEPVTGGDDGSGGTIVAGPSNDAGWGRVSIENTMLQSPASDHGTKIFNDQRHAFTASGQEYRIRVAAADPAMPLRVALSWTDAAGAVGASPALVNDLDLEVVEVDTGDVYVGNNFTGAFSAAGGTADSLNNLEIVALQNTTGLYEISVIASNLAASARTDIAGLWQDFALVIDNGEVPAADPVSVVPVIDRSGSMQAFGYVDVTRQSSRQFIDLMSVDDSVGVVSFGDTATQEFPPAGGPSVIVGAATRGDAKDAVDSIAFGGCTFMGDGIATAGNMLAGSGPRSAIVVLSDGYDNKGCDSGNPLKPSAIDAASSLPGGLPIYSCAMGPASDQATLEQIATNTDGRYYYMPTIDDLFEIYNYIRGQVTGEGVIVNESAMASRSWVRGFVDGCSDALTFTVAWHDPALRYTAGPAKSEREISVRLRTPGGRWVPYSATEVARKVGDGYAVFMIEDPQPGWWTVEVSTNRRQHTPYTVGGFVRSDVRLDLTVPSRVALGQVAGFKAALSDGKRPINDVKIAATAFSPIASMATLAQRYKRHLAAIKIPDALAADMKLTDDIANAIKLTLLRDKLRKDSKEDILEPVARAVRFTPPESGGRSGAGPRGGVGEVSDRFSWPPTAAPVRAGHDGGLIHTGGGTVSAVADPRGTLVDWRRVVNPVDRSRLVGSYGKVSVTGSYSLAVTARGFSSACKTGFVRKGLASFVAVEDWPPQQQPRTRHR